MSTTVQVALDERLEQALQAANYRITLNAQMDLARLNLKEALTVSSNGGTFSVDLTLITFVYMLFQEKAPSAILLDVNQNPIEIDDLPSFFTLLNDTYHQAHNDFMATSKNIRKARTTKGVVSV